MHGRIALRRHAERDRRRRLGRRRRRRRRRQQQRPGVGIVTRPTATASSPSGRPVARDSAPSYSNYGPLRRDFRARRLRQLGVLSTLNDGARPRPDLAGYILRQYYQGTSMATPHVTGIVSLMLSRNPSLTPAQVTSILQTTARAFPTGTGTRLHDRALRRRHRRRRGCRRWRRAARIRPSTVVTSSASPAVAGTSGHLHRDGHRHQPDRQRRLHRQRHPDHRLHHAGAQRHRQRAHRPLQHRQPRRRHPPHRRQLRRRRRQRHLRQQRAVAGRQPARPPRRRPPSRARPIRRSPARASPSPRP